MGRQTRVSTGRLVLLGGGLLAALALLAWGQGNGRVLAHTPHPGVDFSMLVSGNPACSTQQGDTLCVLEPGARFTVQVKLNSVPTDVPAYTGFDIELDYSGVTSIDNASTSVWPDCAFPASYFSAGLVSMGCAIGIPPAAPSSYLGIVASNDFTCAQSGAISLKNGEGSTDIIDPESNGVHASGAGTLETLNISCGPPPTATPAPGTAVGPGGLPAGGSGGENSAPPWLELGTLLALAGTGLAAAGWKLARGR